MEKNGLTELTEVDKTPWERLKNEPMEAWRRFEIYRDGERSFQKVADITGVSRQTIYIQSSRYKWADRCQAYDLEMGKIRAQARGQAIAKAEEKRTLAQEATRDRILLESARIAFSDLSQAASWDNEGLQLHDSQDLSPDVTAAIQEISVSYDKQGRPIKKIKMHNKNAMLDRLGQKERLWGGQQESQGGQTVNNYLVLVRALENPRFSEALREAAELVRKEDGE